MTNHSHNELNGNIRIVVTTNYLKHDNGVGGFFFSKQTMEFPAGTMKDLTEVYCTSEGAASQCKKHGKFQQPPS